MNPPVAEYSKGCACADGVKSTPSGVWIALDNQVTGSGSQVSALFWLGLAWLGLAWLGLAWLGLVFEFAATVAAVLFQGVGTDRGVGDGIKKHHSAPSSAVLVEKDFLANSFLDLV